MLRGSGGAKDSWDAFERAGFCNVLVWSANALVSFLTILKREALFDGRQVILGGVSSVMTPPEHQRNGYASLAGELCPVG